MTAACGVFFLNHYRSRELHWPGLTLASTANKQQSQCVAVIRPPEIKSSEALDAENINKKISEWRA